MSMENIFKKILWGCEHEWERVEVIDVYDTSFGAKPELPRYSKWIYECKKCKKVKVYKV